MLNPERHSERRSDPPREKLDLVKLALTLMGCAKVDEVIQNSLRLLREFRGDLTWAILHQIESKRYETSVVGQLGHAELRHVAEAACGPDVWLSLSRLTRRQSSPRKPLWRAVSNHGEPGGRRPDLVVACWPRSSDATVERMGLATAARIIVSAIGAAQTMTYLVDQSSRDPLTRLLNRRGILDVLERERARSCRRSVPLSVLFLDIDGFKEINDQNGHLVGDEVLSDLGGCLACSLRASDAVGRLGGDEFLIVLPDTDLGTARRIARRLVRRVSAEPFTTEAGEFRIGLSYGAASASERARGDGMVERADQRMLAQKRRRKGPIEPRSQRRLTPSLTPGEGAPRIADAQHGKPLE